MQLHELADNLHRDLDLSISPAFIHFWLRAHLGDLNNLLDTSYIIDATNSQINPELGLQETSIFQCLYNIYHYDSKARSSLGAASVDSVIEVSENGQRIRLTNKNEISKTYVQLKTAEEERLMRLVNAYKMNKFAPLGVAGKDTVEGYYEYRDLENRAIT